MTPRELSGVSADQFHAEIVSAGQPVVLRGLVADWPAVQAARQSDEAVLAHLARFERGAELTTLIGEPEHKGRFFYDADLGGFNFQSLPAKLTRSFDFLLAQRYEPAPITLAVQSIGTHEHLPGFGEANPNPLLELSVEGRLWIGNRAIVAAHQDPYENLACVVAGQRRFTLFPPSSVGDLYVGPFERTPGGPPISLVSFDDPDLARHPRFAEAMEAAVVADLEPGDAIYIPYLWWHHVRSLAPLNILANYWWTQPDGGRGQPYDAFLHAVLALRALPQGQRAAWKATFDHYVFGEGAAATDHLPVERRGMLGELSEDEAAGLRKRLGEKLLKSR